MSAASIAAALGGKRSGQWWRLRCPVHGGRDGSDTLAIRDGERGLFVKCHAGCDRAEIIAKFNELDLMMDNGGPATAAPKSVIDPAKEAAERARRIAVARDIWLTSVPADETFVLPYWWSRLLLVEHVPETIRFHRAVWHSRTRRRRLAMVCRVDHVDSGPVGVHVTYLELDHQYIARKAPIDPQRQCLGVVGGGAVRLAPIGDDETLIVGEGLETVASVMVATGLPGWAALSAGNLPKLVLPPSVRRVIIAADNDKAGRTYARAAARHWRAMGLQVTLIWPPEPGQDFNDILRAEGVLEMEGAHV